MVYGTKVMLLVQIETPIWHCEHFNEDENEVRLIVTSNMIDEA